MSISVEKVSVSPDRGFIPVPPSRTITTHGKINDISDPNIDDTKEALVLLFELLLIEDLDRQNAILVDSPISTIEPLITSPRSSDQVGHHHVQVEGLIPVRIQSLLNHRSRMGLFAPYRSHGEWIGES